MDGNADRSFWTVVISIRNPNVIALKPGRLVAIHLYEFAKHRKPMVILVFVIFAA